MLDKKIFDQDAREELLLERKKQGLAATLLFMLYAVMLLVLGIFMLVGERGSVTLAFVSLFAATISASISAGYMAKASDYTVLIKLSRLEKKMEYFATDQKKTKETKEVKK